MSAQKEKIKPMSALDADGLQELVARESRGEGVERLGILQEDYTVDNIVDPDVSMMEREGDGLKVTLWMAKNAIEGLSPYYVTVEDRKGKDQEPKIYRLNVPERENPIDKKNGLYYHPLAAIED